MFILEDSLNLGARPPNYTKSVISPSKLHCFNNSLCLFNILAIKRQICSNNVYVASTAIATIRKLSLLDGTALITLQNPSRTKAALL